MTARQVDLGALEPTYQLKNIKWKIENTTYSPTSGPK
jgi:hypothetical protein